MLNILHLTMQYGIRSLFDDVSLQLYPGHRYGLVGANGSGKSTLMRIISGEEKDFSGQIQQPANQKLGVLQQDHFRYENETILDTVLMGRAELWQARQEQAELLKLHEMDADQSQHFAELEDVIHREGGYTAESEAAQLLDGLGIPAATHQQPLHTLSGGYKLRILMAQLLFSQPDVLLLDEPTNHLDIFSIRWLEQYLRSYEGLLLVISHDRDFINAVSTDIVDIDYGTIKVYTGNYEQFLAMKDLEQEQKEKALKRQDEKKAELQAFVDRFKAKATKASQAQSRVKMIEKMEAIDIPVSSRRAPHLNFSQVCKSGIKPLEVVGLSKSFEEKQVLNQISFEIERGDKIALIGPNGIGKSTFLKILMGQLTADEGTFTWGYETYPAYFPQDHHDLLKGNHSVYEWLYQFDALADIATIRGLLARALFTGDDAAKPISVLSGGEASRLILAQLMLVKHNVLLLDEPTNHLDMESIDELARALHEYPGTVIIVSHNRYFVGAIAKRIIEITPTGLQDFKGTYAEYLERQGTDHLTRDVDLKQRSSLKAAPPAPEEEKPGLSYNERKDLQKLERQLQKQIEQSHAKMEKTEQAIAALQAQLEDYEAYLQMSPTEQQALHRQKKELEEQTQTLLNEWEDAENELLKVQETLSAPNESVLVTG